MIEKIDSTSAYEYQKRLAGNSALNTYERVQRKSARPVEEINRNSKIRTTDSEKSDGVILDLSVDAEKSKEAKPKQESFSILKSLQNFFLAIRNWLIDFWESDSQTVEQPVEEEVVQAESQEVEVQRDTNETAVTTISDEDLELYTLMAELSASHITLDDLDTVQVSRLLEIGVDIDEVGAGTFDYTKLLEEWSAKLGLVKDQAAVGEEGKISKEIEAVHSMPESEVDSPLIQEAVQAGSLSRLEELITQNGRKKLAHNSDLLTYYDKKGKIVQLDDTQKSRVLYGDRHILKL